MKKKISQSYSIDLTKNFVKNETKQRAKKSTNSDFLSIGEVSKIMNVSHTSLRYYDEIGILKPAYINQDTGYRYYSKKQIPLLSLILLAIELDIPLKEFEKYIQNNNNLDLEDFVIYTKNKLKKTISKLERDLYFLEKTHIHFQENSHYFTSEIKEKTSLRQIKQRHFITLAYNTLPHLKEFDFSDYWQKTTELYAIITKHELSASVEQGILFHKKNEEIIASFFVEIKVETKNRKKVFFGNAQLVEIPKGEYICEFFLDSCIEEAMQKHLEDPSFQNGSFIIFSDILDKKINTNILPFEIQTLKKK